MRNFTEWYHPKTANVTPAPITRGENAWEWQNVMKRELINVSAGDLVSSHKTYHDHFIHDWGRRLSAKSLRTRGSSLPVKGAEPTTPSWIRGSRFHNPLQIVPFLCVPILANSPLRPLINSFDCRLPVIAVPHPIANCRQFPRVVIAGARGGLMPVIILIVTPRPLRYVIVDTFCVLQLPQRSRLVLRSVLINKLLTCEDIWASTGKFRRGLCVEKIHPERRHQFLKLIGQFVPCHCVLQFHSTSSQRFINYLIHCRWNFSPTVQKSFNHTALIIRVSRRHYLIFAPWSPSALASNMGVSQHTGITGDRLSNLLQLRVFALN